ncbi:MAG: hypothetical protein AAGF12_02725 [Myxococcota bacterium]
MLRQLTRFITLACLLGCGDRTTAWELQYEPAGLEQSAASVYVEIRRDQCDGDVVFASDLAAMNAQPPRLVPGRYAFVARASNTTCEWFARGCQQLDLPLAEQERISVTLQADGLEDRCSGSCFLGSCQGPAAEGGTDGAADGDAGTDGGADARLAIEVSAGRAHTCARLRESDAVYCWGLNETLQLGAITGATEVLAPIRSELEGAVALATGGNDNPKDGHTCAIVPGGEVRCWGDNHLGQHGNSTTTAPSQEPKRVRSIGTARAIDAGRQHTCVINNDAQVHCWGANESGQLGRQASEGVNRPHRVQTSSLMRIATGAAHTCGATGGGAVRCWGDNRYGQLGSTDDMEFRSDPQEVPNLTNVGALALSSRSSCALLMTGQVVCWGQNGGMFGDETLPSGPEPQTVPLPERQIAEIVAGSSFACARFAAGDIYCWGSNRDGNLGRGVEPDREDLPPAPVLGIDNAIDVSAGDDHACAVTEDGRVLCWGNGGQGRLGNGTVETASAPQEVIGFGAR